MTTATVMDPQFDRDKFLMRQKHLAIREKYYISDEQGREILFIERPRHFLRGLGAALAGVLGSVLIGFILVTLALTLPSGPIQDTMVILALLVAFVSIFVIAITLGALRHVTIYRDDTKRETLLGVRQDKKFQPIRATYTVQTPAGQVLGHLEKNYLYDLLRKRWYCRDPDGRLITMVKEDSILKSVLRRGFGPLFGLLRTNFKLYQGQSDTLIGEFNRKFTILDRYVLDMTLDLHRSLDRRLAVAIGIMLDSGERR